MLHKTKDFLTRSLSEISSFYQSRVSLTIHEIYLVSSRLQSDQIHAISRTAQQLNEQSSLLNNILSGQSTLLSSQSALNGLLQNSRTPNEQPRTLTQGILTSDSSESSKQVVYIQASHCYRCPCPSNCSCTCHKFHTFRSPPLFNLVIGDLFVGYSGNPSRGTFQRCTEVNCLSHTTFRATVHYIFPAWFLAKAIVARVTIQSLGEIRAALEVQRIVPDSSEILRFARLNDVDGVKQLYRNGLASPHDRGPEGITALNVRCFTYICRIGSSISTWAIKAINHIISDPESLE